MIKPKDYRIFFLAFVPLVITLWLYFPVLKGHFNGEDGMILGDAVQVLTKGNFKYLFYPWYGSYARLFLQLISVVLYKIFGYNSTPFLATSLFFHLLNVLLTFILALKITKSKIIALFSSLFYGVYQVNYEGLTWVFSGIKDIPMTTFFLISYLLFISYLKKGGKLYLIFCYLSFALSLSCEFKALFIPLIFIAHEFLLTGKKLFSINTLRKLFKYLPFFLFEIIFVKLWYKETPKLFYGVYDWQNAIMVLFASLTFYILPISRIYWTKIYTNAHGLTTGHSDELYLKELGILVFISIAAVVIFHFFRKEKEKARILVLLAISTFINYLPILFTVLSKYHTLWAVLTVHWRYFTLASPTAAILITSCVVWTNNEIGNLFLSKNFFSRLIKLTLSFAVLPIAFLTVIVFFHLEADRAMLNNGFLKWTVPARNFFATLKKKYPSFPQESVLVIEGTNDEKKVPFFGHRYLLENLFPLYAVPNNPNYSVQQQNIPLDPNEGYLRSLDRLLFYTNLKDILVGKHQHLYKTGKSKMVASNIPVGLPAVDRLFLGVIYGLYDPQKVYVFTLDEKGKMSEITAERRNQLTSFTKYFCFGKGVKTCQTPRNGYLPDSIKKTLNLFSAEGKLQIESLIYQPKGKLPYPYRTDITYQD